MENETQNEEDINTIEENNNIDDDNVANKNMMDVLNDGIKNASQAVGKNIQQMEETQDEIGINDDITESVESGGKIDGAAMSDSLRRFMKAIPAENVSGAMSSYVGFINMLVKKVLNRVGIHIGTSDEQFQADLKKSVVSTKQLTRVINESMNDPQTKVYINDFMLKSMDMLKEFTSLMFTAFMEQGASLVLDNGDRIAGIIGKSIESGGRAIVDGTLNAFSAVPIIGNFFSIIRTIHSLAMPLFTIGGGTIQLVMTGLSTMYLVMERLHVPAAKSLNATFNTFEVARRLGNHLFADIRDSVDNGKIEDEINALKQQSEKDIRKKNIEKYDIEIKEIVSKDSDEKEKLKDIVKELQDYLDKLTKEKEKTEKK